MKTYALVPLDAIMHATDFMDHAKQIQAEAAEAGLPELRALIPASSLAR